MMRGNLNAARVEPCSTARTVYSSIVQSVLRVPLWRALFVSASNPQSVLQAFSSTEKSVFPRSPLHALQVQFSMGQPAFQDPILRALLATTTIRASVSPIHLPHVLPDTNCKATPVSPVSLQAVRQADTSMAKPVLMLTRHPVLLGLRLLMAYVYPKGSPRALLAISTVIMRASPRNALVVLLVLCLMARSAGLISHPRALLGRGSRETFVALPPLHRAQRDRDSMASFALRLRVPAARLDRRCPSTSTRARRDAV
ncbi:hypothetical protein BDV24DRAFT_137918 [Aspergillus arachidicola]|uniref:Uncharacterized protein n=1 Tax=Aspergillus arachidicola TaxID=656916 RepID=A0A5N6XZD2_9EURO|nr:hypothetical protein BDV24DRAFT_137918 [Aspergillus arachidicola]